MDPKNAARDYLLAAERYIKDSMFDEAQREVKKAQEIDPSNIYTFAFLERIEFFRQQKAKENNEEYHSPPSNGISDSEDETNQESIDYEQDANTDQSETDDDNFSEEYEPSPKDEDHHTEPVEADVDNHTDDEIPLDTNDNLESDTEPNDADTLDNQEADTIDTQNKNLDFNFQDLKGNTDESPKQQSSDLTSKIEELENRLQVLTKIVEESGSNSSLSVIAEKFEQLEEQITAFQTSFEERQQQFEHDNNVSEKLREFENQLLSVNESVSALQNQIGEVNESTQAETFEQKINELEHQLQELHSTSKDEINDATQEKIEEIERRLNDFSVTIQAEQETGKDYDRVESILDALQQRVEDIASSFTTDEELNKRHDEIRDKFRTLDERLNDFEQSLQESPEQFSETNESIERTIEHLTNRIDTLEQSIDQHSSTTSDELQSQLSELTEKLQLLQSEVQNKLSASDVPDDVTQQLHEIKEQLTNTREPVTHLEQRFEQLRVEVEQKTANDPESIDQIKAELGELKNEINRFESVPPRIEELSNSEQHLLANYADLEQRFQELLGNLDSKYVSQSEISGIKKTVQNLRNQIEELSGSAVRPQDLQKTQAEILSLYNDLDHRLNELATKQETQQKDLDTRVSTQLYSIDEKLSSSNAESHKQITDVNNRINDISSQLDSIKQDLEANRESRIDTGEIDSRFDRFESDLASLKREFESEKPALEKISDISGAIDPIYQQIEEILETLHFEKELRAKQTQFDEKLNELAVQVGSLSDKVASDHQEQKDIAEFEKKLSAMQSAYEQEQRSMQAKLDDMAQNISLLKNQLESEQQEREETKKRQIDAGLKHYRAALEKAWEDGVPSSEQQGELQNLAELFSLPNETINEMVRDVKLQMYGRAVRKAIAEYNVSQKEALSLEKLRNQYSISIEEYMEYESRFLNDLVSAQFRGTVLLVTSNESMRNDLTDRLKSVGYAVINTLSPEKAIEKLEVVNPQVIVSDYTFSDSKHNGMNLLNVLRRNIKLNYIPFILLTDQHEYDEIKNEIKKPNEHLAKKPVEFYQLLNTINEQLKKLRDHLSSQTL